MKERIEEYGFEEGKDFSPISGKSTGGRPSKDYRISLDMAKELAMVERNEKGRIIRRYFIECEKRLRAIAPEQAQAALTIFNVDGPIYSHQAKIHVMTALYHGLIGKAVESMNVACTSLAYAPIYLR